MSNSKFLYGNKDKLSAFLKGKHSPRFSDLSHYSRLENDLMRDDEMNKNFPLQKGKFELKINNFLIPANDFATDAAITIKPRHCYCLCLSNKKNDSELFDKFKANICIEIDIDCLFEFLTKNIEVHLPNTKLTYEDVKYYNYATDLNAFDFISKDRAVFFKPSFFEHEAEFRIALFYPLDKVGFKASDGSLVPFYIEGNSQHLHFECKSRKVIKDMIIDTFSP